MHRYLIRRLLLTIPVLLGVATLVFSLIHFIPGDPAQASCVAIPYPVMRPLQMDRHADVFGAVRRNQPKSSRHPRLNDDDPTVSAERDHDPFAATFDPIDDGPGAPSFEFLGLAALQE